MNDLPKTKRHRSPGGGTRLDRGAAAKKRKNCDLFIKLGYQATAHEGDEWVFPRLDW